MSNLKILPLMDTVKTIDAAIKLIDGVRKIDPARQDTLAQAMVLLYATKIEVTQMFEALKAAHPVLLEANEQWSNGEDCYTSALELTESIINPH